MAVRADPGRIRVVIADSLSNSDLPRPWRASAASRAPKCPSSRSTAATGGAAMRRLFETPQIPFGHPTSRRVESGRGRLVAEPLQYYRNQLRFVPERRGADVRFRTAQHPLFPPPAPYMANPTPSPSPNRRPASPATSPLRQHQTDLRHPARRRRRPSRSAGHRPALLQPDRLASLGPGSASFRGVPRTWSPMVTQTAAGSANA